MEGKLKPIEIERLLNSEQSPKRIFVVGCARSGTTLFQAMLSAHPMVMGFPETFYFRHCADFYVHTGVKKLFRRQLAAREALIEAARRVGAQANIPSSVLLSRPGDYHRAFVGMLDSLAEVHDSLAWSEKTPGHINDLDVIRKNIPGVYIIHVVRDGRDVVASLYDIYLSEDGRGAQGAWDLTESIARWNRAIRIALEDKDSPRTSVIGYESLVANPLETMRNVSTFLDLDFDASMLEHQKAAENVLGKDVVNKARLDVLQPVKNTHLLKFNSLFESERQNWIVSQLLRGGDTSAFDW